MISMMTQVTTLLAHQLIVYAAECHIVLQMVGTHRALLATLAVARDRLLLARLTFFSMVNRRGSDGLCMLVRQVVVVDLAYIWRAVGHVHTWWTVLDDLFVIWRHSDHTTGNCTGSCKTIVPGLEALVLGIVAWRANSHVVWGWALTLRWHRYLSVVLRLGLSMCGTWVKFSLDHTISLSNILWTAISLIKIGILLK